MSEVDSSLERAIHYWSGFFGLAPEAFEADGAVVVPHHGLRGYAGSWVFQRGTRTIVSLPAEMVADVRRGLGGLLPPLEATVDWQTLCGAKVERVIGPVYQGYLERPPAANMTGPQAERLEQHHHDWLASLKQAAGAEAWSHAGIDPERDESIFACKADGQLVAAAQNRRWHADVVSPGVVTAPRWRNRGFGRAVLAAAMRDAIERGDLVLYQTLVANRPAVVVGEALGVRPFAHHLALRFSDLQPTS